MYLGGGTPTAMRSPASEDQPSSPGPCVRPYNNMSETETWRSGSARLKRRQTGASVVCPGHGLRGAARCCDQQKYFKSLRERVGALVKAKKPPQEVRDSIEKISSELSADAQIARYVGKGAGFASQVEKVYTEMTGQKFPEAKKTARAARDWHALSHGLDSLG